MKVTELGNNWSKAYEHCLNNYTVKEAIVIAKQYRPQKLYKYYSFSSEYWRGNAYQGQLAFSLPSIFNDPLDSRWFIDYKKVYKERFRKNNEEWTVDEFGGEAFFQNCIRLNEEDLLYLRYKFCLCCFSQTPHSNLMWGHYAEKHTGFCLEYDISRLPEQLQLIMPIVYTEAPFDASLLLDMCGIEDEYVQLCPLLFKSKDWSYEKEWRIILPSTTEGSPQIISTNNVISGVYFGFKSYGPEREELEKWAESNNITTYQIERSYLSFDLQSEKTDDIRRFGHTGLLV